MAKTERMLELERLCQEVKHLDAVRQAGVFVADLFKNIEDIVKRGSVGVYVNPNHPLLECADRRAAAVAAAEHLRLCGFRVRRLNNTPEYSVYW